MAYIYTFAICDVENGDVYPDISIRADNDRQIINYIANNIEKFIIIFEEIHLANNGSYLHKNIKLYGVDNFIEKMKNSEFRNDFITEAESVINNYLKNNENVSCDMLFNSSNLEISTYSIIKIKVNDIIDI